MKPAAADQPSRPWLSRPGTIRGLWVFFSLVLAATVIAELFVHLHPHFKLEGLYAFNALFGFLSCVAMVVVAKLLGIVLKRPDSYYEVEAGNDLVDIAEADHD